MHQSFIKNILLILTLISGLSSNVDAQVILQDSLDKLEYEELLTLFNDYDNDSINQKLIALTYLNRAKKERDTIKMARGYDRLARVFDPETNIKYADSIIDLTINIEHKTYPALGYMIKGYEYYISGDLVNSTKSFLKAHEFALSTNNLQQQVYVLDYLIFSKLIWGNPEDALHLQKKRHEIITSDHFKYNLKLYTRNGANIDQNNLFLQELFTSYSSFIECYMQINDLDSAQKYLDKSYNLATKIKGLDKSYMNIDLGNYKSELLYKNQKHKEVILIIDELFAKYRPLIDPSTYVHLKYFKGKSALLVGDISIGMISLKEADSVFDINNYPVQPYHRNLTNILLNHYKNIGDIEKEIYYLNRLIKIDSVFKLNYKYFEPDLIRNFETPELIRQKQDLINQLEERNDKYKYYLMFGLIFFALILAYFIRKQIVYKRRFTKIVTENQKQLTNNKGRIVSKDVVNDVLIKLEKFERDHGYLNTSLSLQSLATKLSTNSNYLSKIINLNIGKGFKHYINDLRIDYALKHLLSDPKIRKYTIKAIAKEAGFNTAASFSRAFYKKHGIYPSYYISRMEEKGDISS